MKRRGFTLIELMVVIAIIIILAAIAIPNYLSMTARAKKSRVAADFGALGVALESYKTDWGTYPVIATANKFGKSTDLTVALVSTFAKEIGGLDTGNLVSTELPNYTSHTTSTGETGSIEYMKPGTIVSMVNPFDPIWDYYYIGAKDDWGLFAQSNTSEWLARTSTTTTLAVKTTVPTTIATCR